MIYVEIFCLGALAAAVPLIVWYMQKEFKIYISKCKQAKTETTEIVEKLQILHNNAMQANADILRQLEKINTDVTALKAVKMQARREY